MDDNYKNSVDKKQTFEDINSKYYFSETTSHSIVRAWWVPWLLEVIVANYAGMSQAAAGALVLCIVW